MGSLPCEISAVPSGYVRFDSVESSWPQQCWRIRGGPVGSQEDFQPGDTDSCTWWVGPLKKTENPSFESWSENLKSVFVISELVCIYHSLIYLLDSHYMLPRVWQEFQSWVSHQPFRICDWAHVQKLVVVGHLAAECVSTHHSELKGGNWWPINQSINQIKITLIYSYGF